MRFLLFFVSLVFAAIFYAFNIASEWTNIFDLGIVKQEQNTWTWQVVVDNIEAVNIQSLSWNLLIESFTFFVIWLVFIYIFSVIKTQKKKIKEEKTVKTNKKSFNFKKYKKQINYSVFYIILIWLILFSQIDKITIIFVVLFILSDLLFNHISKIESLNKYKIKMRYVWLILNYIVSVYFIFFIIKNEITLVSALILLFNIIFNIIVHKKYINYISLFVSIVLTIFLLYNLSLLLL